MPCKGRLARPVRPEHRYELARRNGKRNTAQCLVSLTLSAPVDVGDMIEFKKNICHFHLSLILRACLQLDAECRPLANLALNPYMSPVRFDNLACNGKPQTIAAHTA